MMAVLLTWVIGVGEAVGTSLINLVNDAWSYVPSLSGSKAGAAGTNDEIQRRDTQAPTTAIPEFAPSRLIAPTTNSRVAKPPKLPRKQSDWVPEGWLLALVVGKKIDSSLIEAELGFAPLGGWLEDHGTITGAFVRPKDLRLAKTGYRIMLNDPFDIHIVTLAAITKRPVPVFTGHPPAWTFQGFFIFRHPTYKSAGCQKWEIGYDTRD